MSRLQDGGQGVLQPAQWPSAGQRIISRISAHPFIRLLGARRHHMSESVILPGCCETQVKRGQTQAPQALYILVAPNEGPEHQP